MDTGTITEDEFFILFKKALLTSKRTFKFSLDTALKALDDFSRSFIVSKEVRATACRQAELFNNVLRNQVEIANFICDAQPTELGLQAACKSALAGYAETISANVLSTEMTACVVIPTIGQTVAEIAQAAAQILTWTARIG